MATSCGRVDELVKDYLLYRGLSSTLKSLEFELKNEKEKAFRVDKIIDQLQSCISTYDLSNLRDYWNFLNARLFARLEQRYMVSVRKLEVGLLKLYLINAAHSNKQDKILDFFERMTELLQSQPEFKEWFAFPFVRNPRENPNFALYFSQQWQDTFYLSLHNFLSVILQAMPGPVLMSFEGELRRMKELQAENDKLKAQIQELGKKPNVTPELSDSSFLERSHMELAYDFSSLGEETAIQEPVNKSPRKFPFTSSPLSIGKKSDKAPPLPVKKKDDNMKMTAMQSKEKSQSRASKLLPTIRQKSKTISGQSGSPDLSANRMLDASANHSGGEATGITNQNMLKKRLEDASQKRKELLENNSSKHKEERRSESSVAYNRSVSENTSIGHSPRALRKSAKSLSETKSITEVPHQGQGHQSVAMDTTNSTTEKQGNTVSEKARELQTFPPITGTHQQEAFHGSAGPNQELKAEAESQERNLESLETGNQITKEVEETAIAEEKDTVSEPVSEAGQEKPFLLLSQDEYNEHRSAISYARFSNSGQYIASVDVDGVVKVWTWSPEANTAATVMSKSAFLSLEWASKSDRWLLLGNRSGNIRLFDVKEMKSFYEATADASFPRIVGLCSNPCTPGFVCSASTGRGRSGSIGPDTGPSRDNKIGRLTLWDLKTMKVERILPIEPGPIGITSCRYNHNGQLLIAGGVDGIIRQYDVNKQKCVSQWRASSGELRQVLYSADFTSCYSLAMDGTLSEWSLHKTGQKIRDLPLHAGAVSDFSALEALGNKEIPMGKLLAFDSDGKYLLGCRESNSEIYQMLKSETGMRHFMTLKGHQSSLVTTLDWSPNMDTKICLAGTHCGSVVVSTLLSQ
ncbi:WD repeat-containing protein 91-like isoform X1 [Mya arenaria]|uniref:WD repeat-containing protein 91-like isoform X1 n=1 Tax=Mya arenaria TaxID=6604 RepID=UPI0022E73B9E|nr:WD repeat-containing protein 91-like isoform X1 [Mya arenaria]